MGEFLSPVHPKNIDARIAPHLDSNETVLWQSHPKEGSFRGVPQIIGALVLLTLAMAIATGVLGANLPPISRFVPAAVSACIGLLLLFKRWRRRAELWSYAITDRRLLSVLRNKVVRSVTPDQLDRYQLRINGDIVYWLRPLVRNRDVNSGANQGPDGAYIGFHGQSDPRATKTLIENWRRSISDHAAVDAAAFIKTVRLETAESGERKDAVTSAGIQRIVHSPTGLSLEVMSDWEVTVRTRTDGPLILFGLTLLPRIIRDGPERPYGDGGAWNGLTVRVAPEAGLILTIYNKPSETTLDFVLNDPFTKITGTEVLNAKSDLRIGVFTGFSVTRKMPAAMAIKNVPSMSAPAMLKQVWLSHADISLEITGYALESQSEIQDAIDTMIASIIMPTGRGSVVE